MEEGKQLDFNQPLLSVRRLSLNGNSTRANEKSRGDRWLSKLPAPPPIYKSDLKSGSMRHPGTVPFVWEKAPGRPKDENQPQPEAFQWPSTAPKLPPGRVSKLKQQGPDKTSSRAITYGDEETVDKYKSFKENEIGNCGSEDGDEVFLDAFDTLSRTESLLMNCSATGLSSFDGSEFKPSGPFDLNTRDFMIDRFLPAAKAIASEAPEQHIIKKQPNRSEQPREIKKKTQRPLISHIPIYLPRYETEEDDDYEEPENSSIKVCGLLPRFCLKGSFCLLNPLPGMRSDRSYASSSITSEEAVNEKRSVNGLSQSPLHEQKAKHESQRNFRELLADKSGSLSPVAEKTLYIDSTYEVKHRKSSSFRKSDNGDADSNPNAVDEMKVSQPKILEPIEAFITLSDRFKSEEEADIGQESIKPIKWKDSLSENFPSSISLTISKVADFEKFDLKQKQDAGSCIKESIHGLVQEPSRSAADKVSNEGKFNLQTKTHNSGRNSLLLNPPLPKSPSDSWLKRTLQTAPSRNSTLRYSPAAQNRECI